MIAPWMIPKKPHEQPAQIPLPVHEPERRRPESEHEREPFSVDIGGNNGGEGNEGSTTYRF